MLIVAYTPSAWRLEITEQLSATQQLRS